MQMNGKIIGIDLGATNIHIGIVEDSRVTEEIQIPTLATASKEEIITNLISGIESLVSKDFDGIGIGVPGLVDEEEGVIFDVFNIPAWKQVHLKRELEAHFKIPVRITNDANVFALGEKFFGKGGPYKNMVGVTLGSGLGTGIIIDNKLYSGAYSSAGELGLIPYNGKILEDYCSGKFFQQEYDMKGEEVYTLAQQGDAAALEIFREFGKHLGNAINIILIILSPEAIFLGGSISKSFRFYEKSLKETLDTFPFKKVLDQLVLEPSQTPNISILGAAALIFSEQSGSNYN